MDDSAVQKILERIDHHNAMIEWLSTELSIDDLCGVLEDVARERMHDKITQLEKANEKLRQKLEEINE